MRKVVMSLVLLMIVGLFVMSTVALACDEQICGQGGAEVQNGPIQRPVQSQGNPDPGPPSDPGNNHGVGNPLNGDNPEVSGPIQRPVE